jgi:hypothetical protein
MNAVFTLMKLRVVSTTEGDQIIERRFTAINPVFDVMDIIPFSLAATGKRQPWSLCLITRPSFAVKWTAVLLW